MSGYVTTRLRAGRATGTCCCATRATRPPHRAPRRASARDEVVAVWIARRPAASSPRAAAAPAPRAARDARLHARRRRPAEGAAGAPQLVRVTATAAQLAGLEAAGFDVTENRRRRLGRRARRRRRAARARCSARACATTSAIADLATSYAARAPADARATPRGSAPPARRCRPGRTTYRTYDDDPGRAQGARRRPPGRSSARSSSARRSRAARSRASRSPTTSSADDGRPIFFLMGAAPRARVAVGRGGDGVRPRCSPGAGATPRIASAAAPTSAS